MTLVVVTSSSTLHLQLLHCLPIQSFKLWKWLLCIRLNICVSISCVAQLNILGLFSFCLPYPFHLSLSGFSHYFLSLYVIHTYGANVMIPIVVAQLMDMSEVGQPLFWPKNIEFWLYNLQILTLFWPKNFLHVQLQNNSILGVVINSESHSCAMLQN